MVEWLGAFFGFPWQNWKPPMLKVPSHNEYSSPGTSRYLEAPPKVTAQWQRFIKGPVTTNRRLWSIGVKFTGAEISHRLIAGARSNWKSLRERSWMSLVSICQHGKQSANHQNNFVVPMGNYSKMSCIYCIMVIPMVIPCYQMVIILLQFIQTIFIQIWNQLTQRFCGTQWIKWIRNLKMNSKISWLKLKESWFKWFQDSTRWCLVNHLIELFKEMIAGFLNSEEIGHENHQP